MITPLRRRLAACAMTFRVIATALVSALAFNATDAIAAAAPFEVDVTSATIDHFRIGRPDVRFDSLEFVGGLEMTSSSRQFGGISAFRFRRPGSDFIGVTDTGFWFFGKIDRDISGKPTGISGFSMTQMVDANGAPVSTKWEVDAEGLDVKGDLATVGFERNHRISQFTIDPANMQAPINTLDFLVPKQELRQNRGFETVTRANAYGQHEGALVVVSEKSLDKAGNIFAAIIEGPHKGVFTVKRNDEFDITDGAFLPDGDLLLLERSYSMMAGVKMRLRRIYGESIVKGAVADGPVLLQADMGYQIDNMEAMDVWTREDGAVMVSLMSDDNHSILQRNLYLEFVLHAD